LSFSALTAGAWHTCGLTNAGGTYCWGWNDSGQLGTGSTTTSTTPLAVAGGLTFSTIDAGHFHTCGLTSAGAAYCWGDNGGGLLGRGTFGYSTVPVAVAPF
jgi:alpha-tubulin suppressor-like RCC1 family protein